MSVTTCPSCGTPAPPGAMFCDNCGYDLRTVAPAAQGPEAATELASPPDAGEIICPTCQQKNIAGSAFCENCGAQLSQVPASPPQVESPVEEATPPSPPTPVMHAPTPAGTPETPVEEKAPAESADFIPGRLVIQESNVSLPIPSGKQTVVIGREDPVSGVFPDIDLDPHGGHEAGVGRKHAQLVLKGGQIHVEDLESVNGTVVNKKRLSPNQPHPISDGDELRFGKMVLVYHEN